MNLNQPPPGIGQCRWPACRCRSNAKSDCYEAWRLEVFFSYGMTTSRIFKKIDNELRTATDPSQIGAPHAFLGVIVSEEDWIRALYRAYELGKTDRSAEIRSLIG